MPETHPLARQKRVALEALRQEPFIGYDEQAFPGRNELIATLCGAEPASPQRVARCPRLKSETIPLPAGYYL